MINADTAVKLTYADYRQTPDDERYELLDGDLIMTPAPNTGHQTAVSDLSALLNQFVKIQRLGRVLVAPFDVVLSDVDVVQPDILFISNERVERFLDDENLKGPPDLAVEVLSPSTAQRDRSFKRALYARHGVKEYWIVDPDAKTVSVLLLDDDRFRTVRIYAESETVESIILDGFQFDADAIF